MRFKSFTIRMILSNESQCQCQPDLPTYPRSPTQSYVLRWTHNSSEEHFGRDDARIGVWQSPGLGKWILKIWCIPSFDATRMLKNADARGQLMFHGAGAMISERMSSIRWAVQGRCELTSLVSHRRRWMMVESRSYAVGKD